MKRFLNFLFECEHKVTTVLLLFYFLGLTVGSVFCALNNVQAVDTVISEPFISILIKNVLKLFLVFLFGYTAFGIPVICFIVFYSGVCNGMVSCAYTAIFGLKGAVISSLVLFICYFIETLSLIMVAFSSLRLSLVVCNLFSKKTKLIGPDVYAKPHLFKFVIFGFFTFLSSGYYNLVAQNLLKILL